MANVRFPVVVWRDADGHYAACAVHEPADSAAVGLTRSDVLDQVKDYFAYVHQQEPWRSVPGLEDVTLTHFKVTVRPESRITAPADGRKTRPQVFASPPVSLLIPCVHGKTEAGLQFASAPLLDLFFTFSAHDRLKDTVVHYVQQALKGYSLEGLTRLLPPPHIELDDLIVRIDKPREHKEERGLKMLEAAADPISDRGFKTGLARPWCRETLVANVAAFFSQEKSSAILVGGPGVGKSAVLVEAARRVQRGGMEAGESDRHDQDDASTRGLPRFWQTSGARIFAGMKYLGQWQERVEAMIAELDEIRGVLCVERLLDLVASGGNDPSASIGAFLIPYLRGGELRLVAEATPEELDACRRLLPGLVDACRQFIVEPLSGSDTVTALEQVGKVLTQGPRLTLEPAALLQVHRLFRRFQPYHPMPGPAVAFLGELVDFATSQKLPRIDADLVLRQFTRRTGMPEWLLRDDVPLRREDVLADFEREIIGQPAACRAAADVILAFKAGVNDPHRPLGVLLFAGPTGVGKTEMARAMGAYLFGHGEKKDRLVRLDMSEFGGGGGAYAAERLLGGPRGEPGPLIRDIRQQPFNIVLLDEIEKASPEVFDLLLGLFDEGRLTDRYGRLTTFRSTILIMTSNFGATSTEPFGLARTSARTFEGEIAAHFRPEFFNRIDAVVTFNPLTPETMRQITEKELRALATREGLAARKIRLSWSPAVVEHLVNVGFDKRYGARPLQRTIEDLITTPLARGLAGQRGGNRAGRSVELHWTPTNGLQFRGLD